MDLMARPPRLPQAGETLIARSFIRRSGGKGSNQAVAAARQGLSVSLVSAVGDDPFGAEILSGLADEGVDTGHVATVPGPSGIAMIVVDDAGENTIVVAPGAGDRVTLEGCDLSAPDAVLAQLEIPLGVVVDAAEKTAGVFCLNASPFVPLPAALEQRCDLIIVNETEYEAGREQLDAARLVCVTLGAAGARLIERGRPVASAPSPKVDAIDTVGAGDAFVAALVAEILRGEAPARALEVACRAGALATTRRGAQASLPYRRELT
jgi:ribokinase